MLKIEKTSQLSGLTVRVRLREKERFFEPPLLKALAIALALHCTALLLFHVTPFALSSTFVFPPVHVQSDQPLQGVSALVSPNVEENDELMPPPPSLIPALDWLSLSQESTLVASLSLDPDAFQSLEERLWPKFWEPFSLKLEEPRIQLVISGDLAELPLIAKDPLLDEMQPFSPHASPTYVTYQVQIDEKGEIFWYELLQSSGAEVDRLTENILLSLRFDSVPSKAFTTGTLNFLVLDTKTK
jgi:hypothetical protein